MQQQVKIKLCGLTQFDQVHLACQLSVDAIGFVFHSASPRNVSVENAARLAEYVPEKVIRVAVTRHPSLELWADIREGLKPDAFQTDIDDFTYLSVPDEIQMWPVIREGAIPEHMPERFVYEGRDSGKGEKVDWEIAASYARQGRMILAGGLSAANVGEAVDTVRPYGVDVSSAVECRPGVKDAGLVKEFIQAAKAAGN